MSRIYKRGKKWAYVAYAGKNPITGKDKQKTKSGFSTKKDAQLAAALFEREFHRGEYIQPSKMSFSDLCSDWEKHYSQDAKESSLRARRIALKHITNAFGQVPIQKITRKCYQDTIDQLSNKFSKNYVSSIHTSANMVFEYAFSLKLIKDVPTKDIKLPKKKASVSDLEKGDSIQGKFLEKDELEELLTITHKNGLEGDLLAFTMLAYTGMRIGEMIALKWSDIDSQYQTIRIIKTYYNPTNNKLKYQLLTPKTEGSVRKITIDPILIYLLEIHKIEQDKIKKENNPFYNDSGFIFATNEGYPKTIKHIALRMNRLLKKTSIKKHVTPHSFRHTHTSLLIEANVHIKEIQERLGHSDINTTMDIYAHMTKNIKKESSQKFTKMMTEVTKKLLE